MNSKNDSKLTVINNHTENKNKSKLSKQLEQEQNQKWTSHGGFSVVRRKGGIGEKRYREEEA